jgi:hypothetical protein
MDRRPPGLYRYDEKPTGEWTGTRENKLVVPRLVP